MAVQLDEGVTVCLEDVLQEDQELEDTANAVLGDSEDSKCSYSKVLETHRYYHAIIIMSVKHRAMWVVRRCIHVPHVVKEEER